MRRAQTSASAYQEVTNSLSIEKTASGLTVRWTKEGRSRERVFGADEFLFYSRGDLEAAQGAGARDKVNDDLARAFAIEALGAGSNPKPEPESLLANTKISLTEAALVSAACAWAAPSSRPALAVVLFALFALEFLGTKWKLAVSLLLGALAALGLAHAAIAGALAFALLQFFDPNPVWRTSRTLAAIGTAAVSWFCVSQPAASGWWLLAASGAAATIWRWTCGSHARSMPLVLPALCLGFFLDREAGLAWTGLAGACVMALSAQYSYHLFPVRARANAFQETMRS
ncbi:MAG: hypothetical protein AAB036_04295 [Elusimicrobiota bacterium]